MATPFPKEFAVTVTLLYRCDTPEEAIKQAHDAAVNLEGSDGYLGYRDMQVIEV